MKKVLLFLTIFTCCLSMASAQTRKITGTVTDADTGEPIPGVTVLVQGTTNGALTDIDGKYTIGVNAGVKNLTFSFIGMNTHTEAITGDVLNTSMHSDAVSVDEVVVTALGESREKKSLGYASQGVKEEDIMAANSADPLSSLSGKVAGLTISGQNFAGSQNIMIRGASSFSQSNQPLYVVDGVPISSDNFNSKNAQEGNGGYDYGSMSNDLNSYDIANIEVLKGSAASALYGSRGQNGVIMITTKSGKAGKKSFKVELNTGISIENVSILPSLQNQYGGGYGDNFETKTINGVTYNVVDYATDESWGPKFDGQQVVHWWGASDYEKGITDTPETGEWKASEHDVDEYYQTGVAYQTSVNIVSTSENSAVRMGYTNVDLTGTTPNAEQQKHTFNINANTKLFGGLVKADAVMNYVRTDTQGRPIFGYNNSASQQFFQWSQRQLDYSRLRDYKNADGTQRTWNRTSFEDGDVLYSDNVYWEAYENWQDDDRTRMYGKVGLEADITKHLSAHGNVYLDTYTFNSRERVANGSNRPGSYIETTRQGTELNLEGKLQYQDRYLDDKLSVLGMFGANQRKNFYNSLQGSTSGGLVIDNLYNLSNSVDAPTVANSSTNLQVNSIFASTSIGWADMVYLDGTFRTDWDSSLPNSNNKYSYFSVSSSFIASQLIDAKWLSNLKFRLNYGQTGNGTSPYSVYNTYVVDNGFNGNPEYSNADKLLNSDLKPEKTSESEFGVEASFLNNRIGFDFSFYNRNTKNQIVPVEVSGSTGYTSRVINAGLVNNRGVELSLYATPVRTKNFSWDASFNYARNRNLVKDLPTSTIQLATDGFGAVALNSVEGATFQELYAYDYVYDDKGNKVVDENTGLYKQGDFKSMGSVLPDWTGGLRNAFTYKNWDMSVLIDFSHGGKYFSTTHMWGMYSGMLEETATPTSNGNTIREDGIVLDGVNEHGEKNTKRISAVEYGESYYQNMGTPSASNVFDASYIKLRELTIGYTFRNLTSWLNSLRISAYGRNLAVWGLDYKGIDPETVVGGSGNIQGLEGGINPATRTFGFNLKFGF
ncbi:MAG: SusC/RagA family TonB-linked outer membrane protein [Mangrovibacterium sp.]